MVCHQAWLPDFPTSWTRSFTNIDKIYEVLQDIFKNEQKLIDADTLMRIQRSHNGVVFNPDRAKLRGVEKYWSGSGLRRMNEYINVLRNMSFLKKDNLNDVKHEITYLGNQLATSESEKDMFVYFVLGFINIKINNGYQQPTKKSLYQHFKIRFLHNLLHIINYVHSNYGVGASKYQIGLSFLARNDEEYERKVKEYINNYSSEVLKDTFFQDEAELNRAVVSTFLNVLGSLGVVTKRGDEYFLSDFGDELLQFLNQRPAIWYEDLEEYIADSGRDPNYIFAKLMIWRLVQNNLLDEEKVDFDLQEINYIISEITGREDIKDIHINLFYDEPLYKDSLRNTEDVINYLLSNTSNIDKDEVIELTLILQSVWYEQLADIFDLHKDEIMPFIQESDKSLFQKNQQSGRKWHDEALGYFKELGFHIQNYSDNPVFSDIDIDQLKIMLPGGTTHNPDMLINDENFGPEDCILVDAKDQNSINNELPKLFGYNMYSKDPRVDNFTIIALKGSLPESTKIRLDSYKAQFDRITIVEEKALKKLSSSRLSKDEILSLLTPNHEVKVISEDDLNQ